MIRTISAPDIVAAKAALAPSGAILPKRLSASFEPTDDAARLATRRPVFTATSWRIWKNTSIDAKYSYLITQEYDMIEFNLANVANYADLANLMAPRHFMVERGHADGVAPDEWVAYEYAKVRRFYTTQMKMPERTAIEFFDGPHTINGKGTFEFLRRHLRWPE